MISRVYQQEAVKERDKRVLQQTFHHRENMGILKTLYPQMQHQGLLIPRDDMLFIKINSASH